MLEFLKNYSGKILINDVTVDRHKFIEKLESTDGFVEIKLIPENCVDTNSFTDADSSQRYLFIVKSWMLQKSTPDLLFMRTWNDDNPMPLHCMEGEIIKQTSRMYYVQLMGTDKTAGVCSCCGRALVNPVSKLIGIGPECCTKLGINPNIFINTVLTKEQRCQITERLQKIYWEGWIPKTAIVKIEKF